MGINSGREKKELSSLGYPFIPYRSSPSFDPSSFIPLRNSHQPSDWLTAMPLRLRFLVGKTHIRTCMHTPPQHLIRCRDSPVSALLFCCVLTGRCWAMLACECVRGLQGSEPHSRLDAQTRTLSLWHVWPSVKRCKHHSAHVQYVIIKPECAQMHNSAQWGEYVGLVWLIAVEVLVDSFTLKKRRN